MVEENARDVPAWSSRTARNGSANNSSELEKLLNPLFRRAGSIVPPLVPRRAPRGAEVEHWDEAVRCLSVDPVSVVWLCGLHG